MVSNAAMYFNCRPSVALLATNNFYLELDGSPSDVARRALQWLLASPTDLVYLAVLQNSVVDNAFRDIMGRAFVRDLIRRGSAAAEGRQIILVTQHNRLYRPVPTRMLALYPNRSFLDQLDAVPQITDLLAVAWVADDIQSWKETRNAAPLGQPVVARAPRHLSNAVVEAAVRTLDSQINRANGLVGGRDKETAVQIFSILHQAHIDYDPAEVKSFLIVSCSWDAPLAEKARIIASQILEGRNLRQGQRRFVTNILDIWREDARNLPNP